MMVLPALEEEVATVRPKIKKSVTKKKKTKRKQAKKSRQKNRKRK
jgi:hypothetical protein